MIKITAILLCLAYTSMLNAQDSTHFNFAFNHMALSVKDVDRSVEFYKKVFQFASITNRTQLDGIRWLSLSEGKELHLISRVKEPVTINKAVHLAFATGNIDAFVKHLDEIKIDFSDWPGTPHAVNVRADGIKQIYLQDPDGYWIEVNNGYAATPAQQIQNDIWQLEENYWSYVKSRDLKSYLNLWDEKFRGYPSNNIITGKDHISDWIVDLYKNNNRKFNYELTRKAENVFGDIAIALYDVTHIWSNDKNEVLEKNTYKITHTWKKTEKGWVIIGGMGAKK